MRENSNAIDALTPRIMGKSETEGKTDEYPCQRIKFMVDLAATVSTPEGMGIV